MSRFVCLHVMILPNEGRLAADWQQAYGHPVLAAESFVDSQVFRGTCYKAQGWELLGNTPGQRAQPWM